jgi:putative OPT family oligopeptide transporter
MNNEPKQPFKPYVPCDTVCPEFTLRAVLLGSILGIVFGAANAYLGLKLGMTVSASIPAAVISMAVLRGLLRTGTVLENNIVQTIGSSGEGLAAGVAFTIPAFFIWGLTPSMMTVITISVLGGFLGILMMIPLRRYLIVKEHGVLPYPEGTACAEVLVAGDTGGVKAKSVFSGLGVAVLYKVLMSIGRLWRETPEWGISGIRGAAVGIDATPALLGVGFIIGPRIASIMLAGATLGYLVLAPLIAFIGQFVTHPIGPATVPIAELDPSGIRSNYIRYIGAGAVALGGAVSLVKAIPTIVRSFRLGLAEIGRGMGTVVKRTDRDIPLSYVVGGSVLLAVLVWLAPGLQVNLVGALIIVIFGFFFATVSSRIVGIIGSSSNPVSGMTIGTLLVTSLIFVAAGWRGETGMIGAMSVGAVVCIVICMASDASQDLKTGYLVGATPYLQQVAEFVGVLVPALVMGWVIVLFNNAFHIGSEQLPAPQASLMAMVVRGVMTGTLPWAFVIIGILAGTVVELLGMPSLPFAIGLYLPFNLSAPLVVGGLVYWVVMKLSPEPLRKMRQEAGILYSSGLVAGDAFVGILLAIVVTIPWSAAIHGRLVEGGWMGRWSNWGTLATFALLTLTLWKAATPRSGSRRVNSRKGTQA